MVFSVAEVSWAGNALIMAQSKHEVGTVAQRIDLSRGSAERMSGGAQREERHLACKKARDRNVRQIRQTRQVRRAQEEAAEGRRV
jgi:hypothetical protein